MPLKTGVNLRYTGSPQWQRPKPLVAGVAATMLALVAGIVGTTGGMLRAQREADRVSTINEFMGDILIEADPSYGRADVSLVDVLRDASAGISDRFRDHPQLEAEVRTLLGDAFTRLTLYEDGIAHHQRAYELLQANLGPTHPLTRETGAGLSFAMLSRDSRAAIAVAGEVLENTPARQLDGAVALEARRNIASARARLGDHAMAAKEMRQVLAVARQELGLDSPMAIGTSVSLGVVLRRTVHHGASDQPEQDLVEAIELFRDALDRHSRISGDDHANTLNVMLNLVDALRYTGEFEEAESLARRVLQLAPPRYGGDHELSTRAVNDLSYICFALGRYHEAAVHRMEAVERTGRRLGRQSVDVLVYMSDGLPMLNAARRWEVGEEYARTLYERFSGMRGESHVTALGYQAYLARFLSEQGRVNEADEHFEMLLERSRDTDDAARLSRLHHFYGTHLAAQRRFAEAEPHLRRAIELQPQSPQSPQKGRRAAISDAAADLVALYEAWGKPEEAAAIRSMNGDTGDG